MLICFAKDIPLSFAYNTPVDPYNTLVGSWKKPVNLVWSCFIWKAKRVQKIQFVSISWVYQRGVTVAVHPILTPVATSIQPFIASLFGLSSNPTNYPTISDTTSHFNIAVNHNLLYSANSLLLVSPLGSSDTIWQLTLRLSWCQLNFQPWILFSVFFFSCWFSQLKWWRGINAKEVRRRLLFRPSKGNLD